MPTTQQVTVEATSLLNFIQSILPILEVFVPQVGASAAVINLATSAATQLIPIIASLPLGGEVSVQQQAQQYARVYAIIGGSALTGKQWEKQV